MDDLAAAERTIKNANETQFSIDCKQFFMRDGGGGEERPL